jgi:hypothetical protein
MEYKVPSPKTWQDEKMNWELNQSAAALPTVALLSGGRPPNNCTIVAKLRVAPLTEFIINEEEAKYGDQKMSKENGTDRKVAEGLDKGVSGDKLCGELERIRADEE